MRKMSFLIKEWIMISFLAALVLITVPADVWPSCGSANCFLVTGTQDGIGAPGKMTLDISYRYIPMDKFQRGNSSTNEVIVPKVDFKNGVIVPDHHREVRTINELMQVDVIYGVTERFSLQFSIPLMNNRAHEHFDEVGTSDEFFTRQDGSSGLGDIRLTGRYALVVSTRHLFVLGGGIKLPTGEYKLNDSHGEINEPTIMPGTGSTDVLFSFFYDYQIVPHKLDTFFSGNYQLTSENDLDYQFADQTHFNTGLNYLLSEKVSVSGQLNLQLKPHDTFKGQNVPSTGGKWLYVTPGIQVQASDHLGLYTFVQIPLMQDVNEVNIVARYALAIGASYSF